MNLITHGWNDRLESLHAAVGGDTCQPARVIRVDRGRLVLAVSGGELAAVVSRRLAPGSEDGPPTVGDWVAVDTSADTAVVRAILPRTSCLVRRAAGGERRAQLLAANIDLVLVVEGLDRGANPRRIERAAAVAWDSGATPVAVLTKADLAADPAAEVAAVAAAVPFVDVVCTSAADGAGMNELRRRLAPGVTAAMLGPSGAGKSTLANALLGSDRQAVAAVRRGDRKGRHTTTSRELLALPGGGCLIDTPGLRELGLWLTSEAVEGAFADVEALAAGCRFADCRHQGEPGCAVDEAVRSGALDAGRLVGYQRLRREAERLERLEAPRGLAEARAHDRRFARLVRSVLRHKGDR